MVLLFTQTTESLHRHTGPPGRDYRRLLENALGEQLYHCSHVDQTERDGTGRTQTHMNIHSFDIRCLLIEGYTQLLKVK